MHNPFGITGYTSDCSEQYSVSFFPRALNFAGLSKATISLCPLFQSKLPDTIPCPWAWVLQAIATTIDMTIALGAWTFIPLGVGFVFSSLGLAAAFRVSSIASGDATVLSLAPFWESWTISIHLWGIAALSISGAGVFRNLDEDFSFIKPHNLDRLDCLPWRRQGENLFPI
jgi:hypothetical protein